MEKLKLDDFTGYKFLSGVKHSPDGRHACFVLHEMDVEENKYLSNLWLYNIEKDSSFRLTAMNGERGFIWLQDSEHILFSGTRNPKDKEKLEAGEEFTQFYRISIYGGEAQEAFRIPRKVSDIKQVDKNTFLFTSTYGIYHKELNELDGEERKKELQDRKEDMDYEIIDEIPFWSNGSGFTNKQRNRLYIYSVDTNRVEALTEEYLEVEEYNLREDKKEIVFIGQSYRDKYETKNSVFTYNLECKEIRCITPQEQFRYNFADYMSKDKLIVKGSCMKKFGINQDDEFYLLNIESGERVNLTPDLGRSTWNSVGSDCRYGGSPSIMRDGEYLYFITTEAGSSYLNRIDIKGKLERITTAEGSVDGYSVKDENVLLIAMRDLKLQELYRHAGGEEFQLTSFNEWIQKERTLSKPEALRVETDPGVIIDGWVLKPVYYEAGKKYPAILDIHGGPKTAYGEVFYHEMQYWANAGYFVFFCNPRGSDGKGDEFADIRGKYGTIDYEDLMRFTDAVVEKYPDIDSERVGVTGGSYGGFMTNWIIGHTERFKAAASQRSISNWISMFSTTDIGYFFASDQNESTPWENHDKLWFHSPLKYADRVKTPTLFLHSEEDYRCWLTEGLQMFTALKYHGVESRLCMFRGENHELSRSGKPKHRIRRLTEITEWFNKYLVSEK